MAFIMEDLESARTEIQYHFQGTKLLSRGPQVCAFDGKHSSNLRDHVLQFMHLIVKTSSGKAVEVRAPLML